MTNTFYGEQVIQPDLVENFRNYRYVGSDASLLYKFIYSPLAEFMVNRVFPPTLASPYKTKYRRISRSPLLDSYSSSQILFC